MVIANCSKNPNLLDVTRYNERLAGKRHAYDVISGEELQLENLQLAPWQSLVLEIK